MMNNILYWFLLFFIYSFIGWIIEVLNCSIKQKKFVMRGFLIGPYIPIYGVSALTMIAFLNEQTDWFTILVMSAFLATTIEYVTSYIMEIIFKVRWWDYSHKKFHINGRVCLDNSILFGILGLILVYFVHPYVYAIIDIRQSFFTILSIILALLMISDAVLSFNIISNLKINIDNVTKDYTEIIDKKVWETIRKKSALQLRLLEAFPRLKKFPSKNRLK